MAKTEKLTLTRWKQRDGKDTWDCASMDGEKYTTFDEALVQAFDAASLAGREHVYNVVPPKNPKHAPMVVGIPGVYEDPGPGRGGAKPAASGGTVGIMAAGPMLTNRQAALFAAVAHAWHVGEPSIVPSVAENYLKWLEAGSGETSVPGKGVPGRTAEEQPVRGPVSSSNGDGDLVALAGELWPNKPVTAAKALQSLVDAFKVTDVSELPPEAETQLRTMAGGN